MRILFWLEPHYDIRQPGVMKWWLSQFLNIAKSLHQSINDFDFRVFCLDSPAYRFASLGLDNKVIGLTPRDLLGDWRILGDAFMQLEHNYISPERYLDVARTLVDQIKGFQPDVIFLLNQNDWLRKVFPNALFVNIELSWISRAPYPLTFQLDVFGAGKGRILAGYSEELLSGLILNENDLKRIGLVQTTVCQHLKTLEVENFINTFRKRCGSVTLLPLGIFDFLDERTSLFISLEKYFSVFSGDSTIVLTQHPFKKILSDDQICYFQNKYDFIVDGQSAGSQALLPFVNYVIGDFSSLATQCLFFDNRVISIRRQLNSFRINSPLLNPLVDMLCCAGSKDRLRMLYWLLFHYAIPNTKLSDGRWLSEFLRLALRCAEAGRIWETYAKASMDLADWSPDKWSR